MRKIVEVWKDLNKTIYVGERLESNLKALTMVSIISAGLGLVLIPGNILTHQIPMLIAALATFIAGTCCAIFAGILKKREIAILFPTIFCAIVFTIFAVTGVGKGSAILWSLLMPIGVGYFVSVKYGIILSVYHSILFVVLFYSPLQWRMSEYYQETFMLRFPILFICISLFTAIATVQYHRHCLFEIEYTERLAEEVEKQTKVAKEQTTKLVRQNMQVRLMQEKMIIGIADLIESRDVNTGTHVKNTSDYVALLARAAYEEGLYPDVINEHYIRMLSQAAPLHDVGKISVPDAILQKPGKLTDEEFEIIKRHAPEGGRIILDILEDLTDDNYTQIAYDVANYHHEKWDGTGYPEGLSGEDIPVGARIMAIADVYDALTMERVYKKAFPKEKAFAIIEEESGTHFDPLLGPLFVRKMKKHG